MTVRSGTVYLIGCGPGDPGLITVRGLEVLQRADVVVYDRLAPAALLERARPDAELINAGKRPGAYSMPQSEIDALLVERALDGKAVARLKGGDPFVFGRAHEEIASCERAGVAWEVIPGVTSALSAPAAAGIGVTERGVSRGFAVITARDAGGTIDSDQLARYAEAETLVVLMGVEALEELASALLKLGRAPDTPVSIIERAWMAGQRQVHGALDGIARVARREGIRSPAVIVIGAVARQNDRVRSAARALEGRRIVVTRPTNAASELLSSLRAQGAHTIHCPLIEIRERPIDPSWVSLLDDLDWIVVTSRHGARGLIRALRSAHVDARALANVRIAAVGPVTARELETGGIIADLVPSPYRADALVRAITRAGPVSERALFVRGSLARDEVPRELRHLAGMDVRELEVYETRLKVVDDSVCRQIERGVDSVFFASPSAVQAYAQSNVVGDVESFVCIGPTTAMEAERAGLGPRIVADEHSDAGMVRALTRALTTTTKMKAIA